ncbi:MAG: AAA family ATPase [Bacteroidales bacterium]|nr:AAA family ATPase [Bacteroidales bacterium]
MPINQTSNVTSALVEAYGIATEKRNEYLTPEHLLAGYLKDKDFWDALSRCGRSEELEADIYRYINDLEHVPADRELSIEFSAQLQELFERAAETASSAMVQTIQTHHLIYSIFHLEDSYARFHLESCLDCSIPDFLNSLIGLAEEDSEAGSMQPEDKWSRYFRPVEPDGNIVGRKEETAKILRILCRRNKNNALLVGGRGVGKTAIARGIAALLAEENVPEKLKGYELMELNTGMLLSGTQYRGDLEGRVQSVMDSIAVEQGIIVYVDELRSLGGMSRMEDGTKDILSLLNPYFRSGNIKFIISATPEDIKKLNSVDGGIAGLFRIVEIEEPSEEEAGRIIEGILPSLSEYHGVSYDDEVVSHSISLSKRYIMDRCLPDKAIDLLDEAGAYAETNAEDKVTRKTVIKALADICRTDVEASEADTKDDLLNMEERLGRKIFGQEKAIKTLTEAILMSKAGLLDNDRTIGSFLFVGPTGVGKTELSKVLAQQLHVPLHRFDMSEYSEKHSVAKLIGSPAGYVGYDDGGILTDTVRKNPYCVLLLDEIEKAHEDIYNLLLQIMDYAVISDNKGRKADFRNVILIMTSNAGARYAHKASVGFERRVNAGEAMAKEVKNVFAPEFINRLTSVVVFNDMNEQMAERILDDKINRLQERLAAKKVKMTIEPEAYRKLLKEGFSPEYGAREIERVLNSRLTPLLMKEILFGGHKEGFTAVVKASEKGFEISCMQ